MLVRCEFTYYGNTGNDTECDHTGRRQRVVRDDRRRWDLWLHWEPWHIDDRRQKAAVVHRVISGDQRYLHAQRTARVRATEPRQTVYKSAMTSPSSMTSMAPVSMTTVTRSGVNMTSTLTPDVTTLSESEKYDLLVQYNDEKAMLYLPVILYMVILMVVGTLGNILVCCVYCGKPKKTSSHFFILALAVFDLLTCLIGMPTEVTDLRFPYMFYAPAACKLLRFVESVTSIGSSTVLIAVAVDRYLRICKLGKQIAVKTAKRLCIVAMALGVLLAWPACFIFGEETVEVHPGVFGVDCSTDDSMKHTAYPGVYYGLLGLVFICCLVFFTIIYCSIGMQIWRHKKLKIGEPSNRNSETSKHRTFSGSSARETDPAENTTDPHGSDPISTEMSSEPDDRTIKRKTSKDRRISSISQCSPNTAKKRKIKVTRTTVVLFAVTVAYVISYLPFLIMMMVRSVKKDFEETLSPSAEVVYKFCIKSYFINNAINPIIYSFFNINFRRDAKSVLCRCWHACCCCRRAAM